MKTTTSKIWGPIALQLSTRRLLRKAALFSSIIASLFITATLWADPPWSPPVTLSYPAINAHTPAVAISEKGPMVATWVRQENSIYQVQASVNMEGTWSAPVNLSQSGQSAFESSVAIARNGDATAVWTVGDRIETSSFRLPTRRGGWSPPVALSQISISALAPQVVVDAAGNATAMWVRYDMNGVPGIETAYRPVRGNWSAPVLLASGAPRDLMLVINATGDAAAIWDIGAFTSNTSIYVSTRPAPTPWSTVGVWSTPYNLAPLAYRQGGGKIGIAANGDITACWRTNTNIRAADKPARGTWGPTKTLQTSNSVSAYPTLAVTPSGDAMAAWTTYVWVGGSYNYQITSAVCPAGGNWSAPTLLTSSDEYDSELHAGSTTSGACVLTWVDINSASLKSSTWTTKKGWYDFARISYGSDSAMAVGSDTAVAIWMAGENQAQVSTAPIE